jgi:hypothetical protein
MYGLNISNQPWGRLMTAATIRPNALLVHVGMTGPTFGLRLTKNQTGMTRPTRGFDVLPGKGKPGFLVVKPSLWWIKFPTAGIMALGTGQAEFIPMGGVATSGKERKTQEGKEQANQEWQSAHCVFLVL